MNKLIYIIITGSLLLFSCNQQLDKDGSFKMAKEYSDNQDFNSAIEVLNKLIKAYPDFDSAFVERGYCRLNLGEYQEALDDLNNAIDLKYNNGAGYFVRALVYGSLQDFNSALDDYDYLVKTRDKDYYYLALKERAILLDYFGEYDKALNDFMILYQTDTSNTELLTSIGLLYSRKGMHDKSFDYYDRALTINPNYSDVHYKKALLYMDLNQTDSALSYISKAIEIHPNVPDYYVTKAIIRRELNDSELALENLNTAIELDPDNGIALLNRGYLKEQLNDAKGAKADFKRAKELGFDK